MSRRQLPKLEMKLPGVKSQGLCLITEVCVSNSALDVHVNRIDPQVVSRCSLRRLEAY